MIKIPKISYSLLASMGKEDLGGVLGTLAGHGIDMVHYDISENEKTLLPEDVEILKKYTELPFDVHIAVKDPWAVIDKLNMAKDDYCCIHVENEFSVEMIREIRQKLGCRFGLSINIETPVEKLEPVIEEVEFILFMAVIPGISGAAFDESVIEKIKYFAVKHPKVKIHVDGGVNEMTAALLRTIGADVLISGSYIQKEGDYSKQIVKLVGKNLFTKVGNMLHAGVNFPKVEENALIEEVAKEIDAKEIGCVCVVDDKNHLKGLITDADIRRWLIKKSDLTGIRASDIMNSNPFRANPDVKIIDVIRELEDKKRFFPSIPVVGDDGVCIGVLRLQDSLFTHSPWIKVSHGN